MKIERGASPQSKEMKRALSPTEVQGVVERTNPNGDAIPDEKLANPVDAFYFFAKQFPLLEDDEVTVLARAIQDGNTAKEGIDSTSPVPRELQETITLGEAARDRLVQCNLLIVAQLARRYRGMGVEEADLQQEGSKSLLRAADMYDPDKGYTFYTYATYWIKQGILRSLNTQSRLIRTPVHVNDLARNIKKFRSQWKNELTKEPEPHEIAAAMNVDVATVQEILQRNGEVFSLDQQVINDGEPGDTLGDRIPSPEPLPETVVMRQVVRSEVEAILNQYFSAPQVHALMQGFDIGNGQGRSQQDLAASLAMSVTKFTSLKAQALRILKNNADKLQTFWEE